MNKKEFQVYWFKRFGAAGFLFLLIAFLLFRLSFKPMKKEIGRLKEDLSAIREIAQRYKQFDKLHDEADQKKEEISAIIDKYQNYFIKGEMVEQVFLEEIGKISKGAQIKIGKIVPVYRPEKYGEYEKRAWNINFTSDFKRLAHFLLMLENSPVFFAVEEMGIESGRENPDHKITMEIFSVIYPSATVPSESMAEAGQIDIFSLPNKTYGLARAIAEKLTPEAASFDTQKDPFFFGDTLFPVQKKVAVEKAPSVALKGIIWDPEQPQAIIDGKVLKKGDTIRGVTVTQITKTSVTFRWKSGTFTLKLRE